MAAAYAGGKLEELTGQIEEAYLQGDMLLAMTKEEIFARLMLHLDYVLAQHPTKDLRRWLDFARAHDRKGGTLADYYEKNARRIVTVCRPLVDDYSARIWPGLIRDYYLPRWQHYFEQKRNGKPFNFSQRERHWVEEQKGVSRLSRADNPFEIAIQMVKSLKTTTE